MVRRNRRRLGFIMAAAMLAGQAEIVMYQPAYSSETNKETERGEETVLEGTTQFLSTDKYLDIDSSAVELVVEEVYAQAGDVLNQGDKILKLTDESYQEALNYYSAAVISAQNDLTDTQMEYDQGKTDAVSGVSISVGGFVKLAQQCIDQAGGMESQGGSEGAGGYHPGTRGGYVRTGGSDRGAGGRNCGRLL